MTASRQVELDREFMRRALELASRGKGRTSPNPPVGAVVVRRGRIVGEGYHRRAGSDHAEVVALKAAGRSRDTTLYVTLEPCSTQGRTPACTDAIVKSGVKRVVIGTRDPNPEHRGKAARLLKRHDIEVVEGVCEDAAREMVAPFRKWIVEGTPYLVLKLGTSLDGKIADTHGSSRWITSPASRAAVHRMRRKTDAVMVGSGTARADNPSLMPNSGGRGAMPWRIVVDSKGRLPLSAAVLNDGHAVLTIIATTGHCGEKRRRLYAEKGATVLVLPAKKSRVSLRSLFRRLGKMGILHVLCEGGGELAAALTRERLVDEYVVFLAPLLIGGVSAPGSIGGKGWPLGSCPELEFVEHSRIGRDLMVRGVPAVRKS